MRRGPRYWLMLLWCVCLWWPLRWLAHFSEESAMDQKLPRTLEAYTAWLGTLTSEQLFAVHQASDWFATVHARDMDALYAQLMALEERINLLEQRIGNG